MGPGTKVREGGEERGEDAGVKAMFCSSLSLDSLLHKITANSKQQTLGWAWVGPDTRIFSGKGSVMITPVIGGYS